MLRSIGLTPRLVALALVVLWPAVAAAVMLVDSSWRDAASSAARESAERHLAAKAALLIPEIRRYRIPQEQDDLRTRVFERLVHRDRVVPALAIYRLNNDGKAESLVSERLFPEEVGPSQVDRDAFKHPDDEPLFRVLERGSGPFLAIAVSFRHFNRSAPGDEPRNPDAPAPYVEDGEHPPAGPRFVLHAEVALPRHADMSRVSVEAAFLIGLLASLVLGCVVAVFMKLAVSRPIGLLARAMSEIREKRTGATLPVRNEDQLGGLIRGWNDTSLDLRRSEERNQKLMRELRRFNRELEHRVEEATEDLKRKNVELLASEDRLLTIQQDVSRLERMASLGQLSTELAHELSTPLNVVLGHLELLERDASLGDGPRQRVRTLVGQVNRLVGILKDMLSAVRLPDPEPTEVSLRTLVDETVRFLLPTLSARGVQLVREFPEGEAVAVVDRNQAQQVILNIVSNAVEATPDGGLVEIQVLSRNDAVAVRVRDNGKGIAPEHLDRIFEPFFTTKAPGRGTGLGLSISSEIMRRNGGTITARNHPEGGAVFEITFRSAGPSPDADRGSAPPAEAGAAARIAPAS